MLHRQFDHRIPKRRVGEKRRDLRASDLMVYYKTRFHGVPIRRNETDECIDAPWVERVREADLTLDNGSNWPAPPAFNPRCDR